MAAIMGKPYDIPAFARHLNEFASAVRGDVLTRSGQSRRYFYRFTTDATALCDPQGHLQTG